MRIPTTAPALASAAFALSAAALLGAHAFEAAGYAPCPLCLEQRVPHHIGLILLGAFLAAAAAALMLSPPARRRLRSAGDAVGMAVLVAAAAVYAGGTVLAARHHGAELGLWALPGGCGGTLPAGEISAESFLESIRGTAYVDCLQPELFVMGVSLAGWNAAISAVLTLTAALAAFAAFTRLRARH